MATKFELRDRIRTVLMNSENQHNYSKMEDELYAMIRAFATAEWQDGYDEGHDDGYDEGHDDGYCEGCDQGRYP
jgi:flagellar biosynthesis/type III secretory pathway protein FliH